MMASPVRVVLAADDNYAIPLAVTGRSIISNLESDRRLEIYVLDNGITPDKRETVTSSFKDPRVDVVWLADVNATLAGLPTYGFFTTAAYARLLIPKLLPTEVDRVLYFDTDLLVRRDVTPLFDLELGDHVALAVPDMGAPYVSCPWGLANWYANGRKADEFNFNTGMMLIALDVWREEAIGEQAMAYIQSDRYQYNVDQEALNAVVGNRIGAIDPLWNQQGELYQRVCELSLPYSRDVLQQLKDDPWIIHYSNVDKPWHRGSSHPWVPEWFRYLEQTAFAGWKPPEPSLPARLARSAAHTGRKIAYRYGWK